MYFFSGFEISADKKRCVYDASFRNETSFVEAESFCKSKSGVLAKLNDILEIQDILSSFTLDSTYMSFTSDSSSSRFNRTKYYWINRTSDIMNVNQTSTRSIPRCAQNSKSKDRNCIALQYEYYRIEGESQFEKCFTESDQCASKGAIPVCVDKHLESSSMNKPGYTNHDSSTVYVETKIDYSCGDDTNYHLIDGYCLKVDLHETTWHNAKDECQRENATLVSHTGNMRPNLVKALLSRRYNYKTVSYVHVDLFYDGRNSTDKQNGKNDNNFLSSLGDRLSPDDLCKQGSFLLPATGVFSRYTLSARFSQEGNQNYRCGFVNIKDGIIKSFGCDAKSCNRSAAVICQKLPIVKKQSVVATGLVTKMILAILV